jgi:hypothetical protein
MRKILSIISQSVVPKENISGLSNEMVLVGYQARLEDAVANRRQIQPRANKEGGPSPGVDYKER